MLGHASERGKMEIRNSSLAISDPDASNNGYYGIEIGAAGASDIHDCIFNDLANNNIIKGNAINLLNSGPDNEIYNNTFNKCGKVYSNNDKVHVIYCSGSGIYFHHNQIKFETIDKSCG